MIEQLALVIAPERAPAADEAPRCRMCARPARWITTKQQHAAYCSGHHCDNRERICQACGREFLMNAGGAGTKYCSFECKAVGYRPSPPPIRCAWCDAVGPIGTKKGRVGGWPYICGRCLEPIKHVVSRLKSHRVPPERARRLVTDPGCEICGVDLLARVRDTTGRVHALLVVDHDHQCCPVDTMSCGACVRGLLCRACNVAAGQLRDNPGRARALANYLDKWLSRATEDTP